MLHVIAVKPEQNCRHKNTLITAFLRDYSDLSNNVFCIRVAMAASAATYTGTFRRSFNRNKHDCYIAINLRHLFDTVRLKECFTVKEK